MPSSACKKRARSEEHTSELQSHSHLVCRLLLEKKNQQSLHHLTMHGVERHRARLLPPQQPHTSFHRSPLLRSVLPLPALSPPLLFFFFNDTAPTEISPLSLHDPLPIPHVHQPLCTSHQVQIVFNDEHRVA